MFAIWSYFLFLLFALCFSPRGATNWSVDENAYLKERQRLITSDYRGIGSHIKLSSLEEEVNQLLMRYKLRDIEKGVRDPMSFLAAKHFFISKPLIEKTCVYKIMQKLPKGASLHTHTTSMVSYEYLLNNLTYRDNLYVSADNNSEIKLSFKSDPDDEWINIMSLRQIDPLFNKRLEQQISIIRENPFETYLTSNDVWTSFENTFKLTGPIIKYKPVFKDYIYQTLKELYEDNVKYLEIRGGSSKLYDLEGNISDPEETLQIIMEVTENFKKDHPDFMGVKLIHAIHRHTSITNLQATIKVFQHLNRKYPQVMAGFDLVGHEELGFPLKDFISELLELKKETNFFFHAGETPWNGDSSDENLFDAVMLNASRIGHGYAILKHPEIYRLVKERNIPLEISPISNQVLGLVLDLRNHPATNLIANNFPLIITSDDPMSWGAKALSFDWYMAFMALSGTRSDLRFLKQLAINSITFSSMDSKERMIALTNWQSDWDIFIKNTITFTGDCE